MAAILILIVFITLALALRMMRRPSRPNPISAIICLLLLCASAGFTGFLFGDVRASYMGEGIDRAINETHKQLTAGNCEAVTDAYEQAKQARASGASSHESIGNIARSLRATADATGDE